MTLYLYAQFTASKAGISTLADVTIDVDRINKSTGAVDALVTGAVVTSAGNLSPLRNGIYRYAIANVDVWTYDYVGTFKTADATVDLKNVPSLRHEYVDTLSVSSGKVLLQDAQIDAIATVENQTAIINDVNNISSAGNGTNTVTISVDDGTVTKLQGANVTVSEGINHFTRTTDASGEVTFSLKSLEYGVAISKDGYDFTPDPSPATIVVDAAHLAFTKSLSAIVIPQPTDPDMVNLSVTLRDGADAVAGKLVTVRMVETGSVTLDGAYEVDKKYTATTNSDGIALVALFASSRLVSAGYNGLYYVEVLGDSAVEGVSRTAWVTDGGGALQDMPEVAP